MSLYVIRTKQEQETHANSLIKEVQVWKGAWWSEDPTLANWPMDHICPEKGEGTITISRSCGAGLTSADCTILYMSILYINWYHGFCFGNSVAAGSSKAYQDEDYIIILIYWGCRIGFCVGVQKKYYDQWNCWIWWSDFFS